MATTITGTTIDVGTNVIVTDSAGKVGIGTASPARALEVYSTQPAIKLNNGTNAFTIGTGAFVDGSNSLVIYDEGVGERMRIDAAGLVTKPYQAGFYARRSVNGDNRASGAQEWAITGTASRNTGNHFLASNGRFTAPVDGVYFFAATPAYKQSNITLSWNFRVNGTDIAEAVRLIGALDSHSTIGGSTIMKLTASDYVDLNISGLHHANTSYNYFCGHLIS